MTDFNWILVASIVAAAVLSWVHTVVVGRYAVKPRDTEHVINLPLLGTISGLASAGAAFATQAYTLIPAISCLFSLVALFAATDYYYRVLPNVLTIYTAVISVVILPFSILYNVGHWLLAFGVGAALAFGIGLLFLVTSIFFPNRLGMGDVKLAPSLALWVGTLGVAYGTPIISPDNPSDATAVWLVGALCVVAWIFLSSVLSGLWSLLRLAIKSMQKNANGDPGIPFGVFLGVAAAVAVVAIPIIGGMYAPTLEEVGIIY